jgi:hypothetical protein
MAFTSLPSPLHCRQISYSPILPRQTQKQTGNKPLLRPSAITLDMIDYPCMTYLPTFRLCRFLSCSPHVSLLRYHSVFFFVLIDAIIPFDLPSHLLVIFTYVLFLAVAYLIMQVLERRASKL